MEEVLQRIQNILAMILLHDMKDAQQAEKASALSRAGLPNGEIAALLGTTPGVIAQQLYALRASKHRKPVRRAKRVKK
jgi:hypothetical protein